MAELGARLLVVDDNKVNRLLLGRSLELQGHKVASAENGRIALDMLRSESFDLMLLDMEIPARARLARCYRALRSAVVWSQWLFKRQHPSHPGVSRRTTCGRC